MPHNGREPTLRWTIAAGRLPGTLRWQVREEVRHRLIVPNRCRQVFVFAGSEGIAFPNAPEPGSWPRIREPLSGESV